MKIILLTFFLLSSLTLNAEYYISIGNNLDINNSIIAFGDGNNYYNTPLNKLLSEERYQHDTILLGFIDVLKKYQNGIIDRKNIDVLSKCEKTTPYTNIKPRISVSNGKSAIIFYYVTAPNGQSMSTFTPLSNVNGSWEIGGGDLMRNSNLMSIITLMLKYGKQITKDDFMLYKNFLERLPQDISFPIITQLTSEKETPSYVIMYYSTSGSDFNAINIHISKVVEAYSKNDKNFIDYWDDPEKKNIERISENKNLFTLDNPELSKISQLQEGYTLLGITKINTVIISYIITKNDKYIPIYFREYSDGSYKLLGSSIYGNCSMFALSFFSSNDFLNSLMKSNTIFKTPSQIKKQLVKLIKQ